MPKLPFPSVSLAQLFLDEVLQTTLDKFRRLTPPLNDGPVRNLQFEPLEQRSVMSAMGLELSSQSLALDPLPFSEPAFELAPQWESLESLESQSESSRIGSLTLRVNNDIVHLVYPSQTLSVEAGDFIQVVAVNYELANDYRGIVASEGYLSKLGPSDLPGELDYADGRYSDPAEDQSARAGKGLVPGLQGGWKVQSGWDRLTVTLVNYHGDNAELLALFHVQLQVGLPDFSVDSTELQKLEGRIFRVGQEIELPAILQNLGEGNFRNYAEIDIYHESDPQQIVWAGALSGNLSAEYRVTSKFVNNNPHDAFDSSWTPQRSGTYLLRITADPESLWSESNEANNLTEIRLQVADVQQSPPSLTRRTEIESMPPSTGLGTHWTETPCTQNVSAVPHSTPWFHALASPADDGLNYSLLVKLPVLQVPVENQGSLGHTSWQSSEFESFGSTQIATRADPGDWVVSILRDLSGPPGEEFSAASTSNNVGFNDRPPVASSESRTISRSTDSARANAKPALETLIDQDRAVLDWLDERR